MTANAITALATEAIEQVQAGKMEATEATVTENCSSNQARTSSSTPVHSVLSPAANQAPCQVQMKCLYCSRLFDNPMEKAQHEEIHVKLGHGIGTNQSIDTLNTINTLPIRPPSSCKFATVMPAVAGTKLVTVVNELKPFVCPQCGLLCPNSDLLIQHLKEHEALSKMYLNQALAGHYYQPKTPPPSTGMAGINGNQQTSPLSPGPGMTFPLAHAQPHTNNSMLEELCSAAVSWNTFYASSGKTEPHLANAVSVTSQPNLNIMVNNTLNTAPVVAQPQAQVQPAAPTQPTQAIPNTTPPKKKKKRRPKNRASVDDIFECEVCLQQFATEFHRNIHANSHKFYNDKKSAANAQANTTETSSTIESSPRTTAPPTTINTESPDMVQQVSNNNNTTTPQANDNTSAAPSPHLPTGYTSPANSYAMSTGSSYTHTTSMANMTTGLPTCPPMSMAPMINPNQYSVSMPMPHTASHAAAMFPLLHRPASAALSAPVSHMPQQPLFPQPIPQPVFPQR